MKIGRSIIGAATFCIFTAAFTATGFAAQPAEGTISEQSPSVTWEGGPFIASNPAGCRLVVDPTCDRFRLTIDAAEGVKTLVAITADRPEGDDLALYVHAPDGTLIAASDSGGGNEQVVIEHKPSSYGTGPYEVGIAPWLVTPGATYQGVALLADPSADVSEQPGPLYPAVTACNPVIPDSLSIAGVTDAGNDVSVDAIVLLDGITLERGQHVLSVAATPYSPLGVTLAVAEFMSVELVGNDSATLMQQARDLFGGTRPPGIDVVHILTSKDISSGAVGSGLNGQADCIGGVRFPEKGFSISEDFLALMGFDPYQVGPFTVGVEATAKQLAHEIGHSLGAQHHFMNCIESTNASQLAALELSPCTLMAPTADLMSLKFSSINGAIVRGYAVDYADN